MNDNTFAAIVVVAIALTLHSCASCEKAKNANEHERMMETLRFEHSQKAGKP